jgi:hypothetical protein
VSVPGTFAYSPPAGTVLTAGNNQTLSVTFTPTDATDYTGATAMATINVLFAPATHTPVHRTAAIATAKPRSSHFGRPITLAVTVRNLSHGGGIPTGDVTFLDGTTILGLVPLRRGKARLRISSLPVGRDPIQVDYGGAEDFTPSVSAPLFVTIRPRRSRMKAIRSLAAPRSRHLVPWKATVRGVGGLVR